ncbi:mitochondrial ribosome-associated GTPase 2 [Condylostylus longicornis]|uniref:mitochondrial ribosome-associated GTPase 2 n=1 Tax=Condylostylus longicornis TaxID=2530218 RepID=UPI00244DFD88|nr:mitochondrial ribosome-associated GTPase 2 [Condylostylus longicornis]
MLFSRNSRNILKIVKHVLHYSQSAQYPAVVALRPTKLKSKSKEPRYFTDSKYVSVIGGKGGDGCISFLSLWANEYAGPDGGDGGNGGHIIFEASREVNNFNHVGSLIRAGEGEKGANKDCHGKNAKHTTIKIPVGTIVKRNEKIVADLYKEKLSFIAARGGAGGRGNHFFISDTQQAPEICEYGARGEEAKYHLELRTMADVGFIGFPNAGKSTLLQAISRARPKVASYAFTTLKPHIGVVHYSDFSQVMVADLPGLIPGSHKNRGLGIQFLKHAERCPILVFVMDASYEDLYSHYKTLIFELEQFSKKLAARPKLIVANKIDLPGSIENIKDLEKQVKIEILGISGKYGTNIGLFLGKIKELVEKYKSDNT